MKLLSTLLVLGGYILVYAAIANHGRFVWQPWMGVFRDAYGVDSKGKGGTGSSSAGANTPPAPAGKQPVRRRTVPTP